MVEAFLALGKVQGSVAVAAVSGLFQEEPWVAVAAVVAVCLWVEDAAALGLWKGRP